MNWKFWQRKTKPAPARAPLFVSEVEQRRADVQRTLALASAQDNPLFMAILSYADEHARNEHETALRPDLVNDVRQFNCGRSACAYDFAGALREIQARAEAEARRLKKED